MIFLVNLLAWEYENFITNVIYGALSLLILFISVGLNVYFYQKDKRNKLKEIKKIELFNLNNDLNNKLEEYYFKLRDIVNDVNMNEEVAYKKINSNEGEEILWKIREVQKFSVSYLKDIKDILTKKYNFENFKCDRCKRIVDFNSEENRAELLLIAIDKNKYEEKEFVYNLFFIITYYSGFKYFSKIENELIIIYRKLCYDCLYKIFNSNIEFRKNK